MKMKQFFGVVGLSTVVGWSLEIVITFTSFSSQAMASPAADGDALIIRTENSLYRVENGAEKPNGPAR